MKSKVAALVLALIGGNVWAVEPVYPTTHPEWAAEDYGADQNYKVFPVYFWWEKGNLWIEIDPADADPSICGTGINVVQNGEFFLADANTATKTGFCGRVTQKQVFRVVDMSGKSFNPSFSARVRYESDRHTAEATLGAVAPEPSPSPAPQFGNPKVSINDLNVLKVTCQRKNKKKPGVLLTEDGSYICDGLPIKSGDKVTITVVGTSK